MMCMQSKGLVKVNNFRRVEAEYETLRQEMDHSMFQEWGKVVGSLCYKVRAEGVQLYGA